MKDLKRGTAVKVESQFAAINKTLVDPTSVKLTLTDPDGTEVVTDGNMTKFATGIYTYTWQSTDVSVLGYYRAYITAVYKTYTVKDNWAAFRLEK